MVGVTHHIHDLLEGETKLEDHSIRLVGNRSLMFVVVSHQVIQQPSLVRPSQSTCHYKIMSYHLLGLRSYTQNYMEQGNNAL